MVNEKRSGRKQIPSTPGSSGSTGSQAFDTRPYLPNSIAVPAVIPSGSLNLDFALGIGGIPRSHITEIYGSVSTGKSTLCQHILAEAQKSGGVCAYIDADHALDPIYAARCGIDVDRLYICEPETAEEALEVAETLARSGSVEAIVIDSMTALLPRSELRGNLGDPSIQERVRLISQALYKLNNACRQSGAALILTNQLRHRFGKLYQSAATSTADLALKLHACVRLELKAIRLLRLQGEAYGIHVRARVVKNKLTLSAHTAELDILYNEGIYKIGDIFDMALQLKIIIKQGSHYTYQSLEMGESRANVINYLSHSPLLSEALERAARQKLLPSAPHLVEH
jgi:recombination protein RecA